MYDDVQLFGIFYEGEILGMSESFIKALEKVLDDRVSIRLLEFYDRFENSAVFEAKDPVAVNLRNQVARLRILLMKRVKALTYYKEVQDSNTIAFVQNMIPELVLSTYENKQETLKRLEGVMGNRNYWVTTIEPREKEDFEEFETECIKLQNISKIMQNQLLLASGGKIELKCNKNLSKSVAANKVFFYSPREAKRPTGLSKFVVAVDNMQIVQNGLKYQIACDAKQIVEVERRSF